jgi:hypothetical protein
MDFIPLTSLGVYTGATPNRETMSEDEFADAVYPYMLWINNTLIMDFNNTFVEKNNSNLALLDAKYATIATKYSSILSIEATTKSYRDQASASAASAQTAKLAIDAKVIPSEATYNYAYIDALKNDIEIKNFLNFKF